MNDRAAKAATTRWLNQIRQFMYPDGGTRGAPTANGRTLELYERKTREMHREWDSLCIEERAYWLARAFPLPRPYDLLEKEEQAKARLQDWLRVPLEDRFYEIPPFGPTEAGGANDAQVGQAWSRRFARWIGPDEFCPDAPWAVARVEFYVLDLAIAHATDNGPRLELVKDTEFSRCADLSDVGGTEAYCYPTDETIAGPASGPPTEEIALALCEGYHGGMVTWDGQPIT